MFPVSRKMPQPLPDHVVATIAAGSTETLFKRFFDVKEAVLTQL